MSNELQTKQIIATVEQKLIGELLNNSSVIEDAVLKLEPRDFDDPNMAAIFGAIMTLNHEAKTVDEHTVIDYLNSHANMQFDDYVVIVRSLASQFGTAADVEDHIDLVKNASIKRKMDSFANEIVATPIDLTDFPDQMYSFEKKFLEITNSKRSSKINTIAQVAQNYQKKLDTIFGKTDEITGTASGYESIDKMTNGFQPGDLIVLAARPGNGKTALALNFLINAAKNILKRKRKDPNNNEVVVMFSLEMGADQICQRLISIDGQVDMSISQKSNWGDLQWNALTTAIEDVSELPILIDDSSDLSIVDIQSKVKQIKMNHDVKLIVVDYLQLLRGPQQRGSQANRQQEVASISRLLKQIARQNNAPVIAIAQLSRKIDERMGASRVSPEPILSDLRESGAIEQDADLVTFIHYKPLQEGEEANIHSGSNDVMVEYIIAKHRNGQTGRADLRFIKNLSKFINVIKGNTPTYNEKKPQN